ncbi:hypothetical protein AB0L34_14020 [Micromonospora sp. NPDC052213]|uniref:hypothetical protein n=1 Tax=Micromonospora sp. NPDC052213 TaxID=3155812 RepID=UPI0034496501
MSRPDPVVDPVKVLRDHAEGWYKTAMRQTNPELRAGYLAMARRFAQWARQMAEQKRR